ncbi:hypothetical protein OIU76_003988 [Salix suchowensis]|nr:hypothetical protein OIU76_003988 [Salix suchowensis]
MATGRPPWGYKASDPMAVVLKIAFSSERPKFPAHLSEEGMDFLAKCLERDPESSVLESIGTYEEEEDSDEPGNPDEHLRWNPFSMRNCGKLKIIAMRQHADNDFGSSGDWITVRSVKVVLAHESTPPSSPPPIPAGDWRVKREESYDDEAVEEIK